VEVVDLPLFLFFAVPIAFVDAREYRIPDELSLGGIAAFLVLHLLRAAVRPAWEGLAAGALGFASFWIIGTASGGRLGLGDAKLSALIAVAAGVGGWVVALWIACLSALIHAFAVSRRGGSPGSLRIPFAPFLGLGGSMAVALRVLGFGVLGRAL